MSDYDVYGIGHALVDMELEVDDAFLQRMGLTKGTMTLVDQARQEELLDALAGREAKRSCGGSGANTLIGLAQFGGRAFHSFKVAGDEPGAFYARDMAANGVDNRPGPPGSGVTGRCLVLITPDAERTMCTHLGISEQFAVADLSPPHLARAEYLYVEGYLVSSPVTLAAARAALALARERGIKTALTFSDTSMIRFFREGMESLVAGGLDLIFCNEGEALAFSGADTLEEAQRFLTRKAQGVAITLGGRGAWVHDGREGITVAGTPVKPVDTNGAGDLFAGAFLHGITHGRSFAAAAALGNRAAARLVTQFGARLAPGQAAELLAAGA
ncbi:MAG: adenosine kinase [Magnetococcales bacterium]|nr:adenosine kinase [Magnetococcales bacterium]